MLDKVKINEKLRIIERERSLLEDYLDISQHINAQKFFESYSENKDIFRILAWKGVISKETKKIFEAAIGARNILVHRYEEVDSKIIHSIIQHHLSDFDKFIVEIGEYLQKEGGEKSV